MYGEFAETGEELDVELIEEPDEPESAVDWNAIDAGWELPTPPPPGPGRGGRHRAPPPCPP